MTAHSGSFFSADDCPLRRCFAARRRPRGATLLKPKDCLYHSIGDSRVGDRVRIRYPAGASRLTGVASKGKATVSLSRTGSHCPWRSLPNGIAGTPGRIRTCDLLLRRQPLYPSELQAPTERKCTPGGRGGQGFTHTYVTHTYTSGRRVANHRPRHVATRGR